MRRAKERDLASLNEARALFDRFREVRRKGQKLPEDLWAWAAEEAEKHSVSYVAKYLGLDYYQLTERTKPKAPQTKASDLPTHTKVLPSWGSPKLS